MSQAYFTCTIYDAESASLLLTMLHAAACGTFVARKSRRLWRVNPYRVHTLLCEHALLL